MVRRLVTLMVLGVGICVLPWRLGAGPYFGSARPGWSAAEETPERIKKEVDEWAARGAMGFKAKGIRPEQLLSLIDQAHRHGLPVTGHLDSGSGGRSVNPRDAIYMGTPAARR